MTPSRIKENFEIFDFELGSEDVDAITALAPRWSLLALVHPTA